jgi:hypothetical protein
MEWYDRGDFTDVSRAAYLHKRSGKPLAACPLLLRLRDSTAILMDGAEGQAGRMYAGVPRKARIYCLQPAGKGARRSRTG